ncbi:MAG: EAL domain-containing protein [Bryobacteraceae bacterium]
MPTNPKPLLVVDDDLHNRDMLSRRFRKAGYEVEVADSGAEALAVLARQEIDLILLDSMMPGMSGIELLKLLRATRTPEDLPVIMVTAVSESDKVVEALELGANDYITKPIDFNVAMARVRTHLTRKHAEVALRESEERYSLAARGANDGLWDWDLKEERVYYSLRWKEMLGCVEDDIGDSPEEWLSRIHPADRVRVDTELEAIREPSHGTAYVSEHRMRHNTGRYRWMMIRGHVLRAADGVAVRMAGSQTDVTENKAFDSLTGLPNRVLLTEQISRHQEELRKKPDQLAALLFLDLDHFKVINDSLGHIVGDKLLVAFAGRLRHLLRTGADPGRLGGDQLIARLGGDEFALLVTDLRAPADSLAIGLRIRDALHEPFEIEGREVFTSASIGIAMLDPAHRSADDLLRDADTAMYQAKTLGRARCEMFSPELRDAAFHRMETENELRRALDAKEFLAYYQPKIRLDSGELAGFEALLRWNHPQRGIVSPAEIIPLAEETGLILPIGEWILHEACAQMRRWQLQYPVLNRCEVSVNLSPRQFRHPTLVPSVIHALAESGLPARCLQLEVTESMFIDDVTGATTVLNRLKEIGVGIKLDDFGTGYSSLSYLCNLPCDSLKIDQSFVNRMIEDKNSFEVTRSIIQMAGHLGMGVTAEGIESPSQAFELLGLGCEFGQGYYFARPMPAGKALGYIEEHCAPDAVPADPAH